MLQVTYEVYQTVAEKRLLRAVILLSYVGAKTKYAEIDSIAQTETDNFNLDRPPEKYLVESMRVKKLILKTFP